MDAKFCDECGAAIAATGGAAEYKQVTVLFADVVHSMDIAAAIGPERLRELMSDLFDRCADVVQRYAGTVDKFTGDGVMAVFGAPVALEDHAIRACLAALDIQQQAAELAADVRARDGVDLQLRIGLNSGEVIAGEVGSRSHSYTTVGDQVGMAQRMESVAPAGGVMLSESTARLVEGAVWLGEIQSVRIKGSVDPVPAHQLLAMSGNRSVPAPRASTLVGREWELAALHAMLKRSVAGHGCVINVVGPPGIGKSRTVAETIARAELLGMSVVSTYCESHTSDVAFQAATRLLRSGFGIDGLADEPARAQLRSRTAGASPADLILLQDELGIRDPADELPDIAPEARRRRLAALINSTVLARQEAALYVIEDVHWIDPTSEALLADFLAVVPRTRAMAIVTYRPEYAGALSRSPGAQTIALAPLDDSQIGSLIAELLGPHPSVAGLAHRIAERAAGNPFFVEEIMRDLADRAVLQGERGSYTCTNESSDVDVPATLQAAIAARIDRLTPEAKRTLNAAAVIGLRFDEALLTALVDDSVLDPLVRAELVDQVAFTPRVEYAFHHPLIRTVAYRSQLTSARAELHRRLAATLERRDPESVDESAALIAEHLEAAGDLAAASSWHMRAGNWLMFRDIDAGRLSWQRARQVADRLPAETPGRDGMRIGPRALMCATAFRTGYAFDETAFEETCQLADAAGDKVAHAMALSGRMLSLAFGGRYRESSGLASQLVALVGSIGEPMLELTLLPLATAAKLSNGEATATLRLAQRVVDLADGDPRKGGSVIESPLSLAMMLAAVARLCQGAKGWKTDMANAAAMVREFIPIGEGDVMFWKHSLGVLAGALLPDANALQETAGILERAQQRGDDHSLWSASFIHGFMLAQQSEPDRSRGLSLLATVREAITQQHAMAVFSPVIDIEFAKEKARRGHVDGALGMLQAILERAIATAGFDAYGTAAEVLAELLLQRGGPADIAAARDAIERLATVAVDPGVVVYEVSLLRLRALLARASGDDTEYRKYLDRYRDMAVEYGYEGHIAKAQAMT